MIETNQSILTPSVCSLPSQGSGDAGYEVIQTRMKSAARTVDEVRAMYKERAEIEADYAKRLGKLAKVSMGREETGSTKQALDVVRAELDMTARVHSDLAAMIKKDLEGSLNDFQAKTQSARKNTAAAVERLYKNKQAQEGYVNKSREKYEQDCIKINGYTAQSSLVQGRDLDKVTSKLDKAQSTVAANEKDYQNFVRALKDTTLKWNADWKGYLDQCQDLEEERLDFIKSNLWNYANAISAVCVADDEGCERVRVALETCETPRDIAAFIQSKGTGSTIPDPPEYINYARGQPPPARPTFRVANFQRQTSRPPPMMPQQQQGPPPSQSFNANDRRGSGPQATGPDVMAESMQQQMNINGRSQPAAYAQPPYQAPVSQPMAQPQRSHDSGSTSQPATYQYQSGPPPPPAETSQPAGRFAQQAAPPTQDIDEEDPIAKALANLRSRPSGRSPQPQASATAAPMNNRHSQQQYQVGRPTSPAPSNVPRPSSPAVAAFMQAPNRATSPGPPVEDVLGSYGQSFPGERKSLSRQGSMISAHGSTSGGGHPPSMRASSPGPTGGFAGVGSGSRAASPQPGARPPSRQQQTASRPTHHQGQSSVSTAQRLPPQRSATPLGISLDASGSVTHDQMAQEYIKRAGSQQGHHPQQSHAQQPSQQSYQQGPPPQQQYGHQPHPSMSYRQQQQQPARSHSSASHHQAPSSNGTIMPGHYQSPAVMQGQQQQQQQHQQYGGPPQQQQHHQPAYGQPPVQQQAAPAFHHQDSNGSLAYGGAGGQYGHGPSMSVSQSIQGDQFGGGRPTYATNHAAPAAETAATAYMHQYQRQSQQAAPAPSGYASAPPPAQQQQPQQQQQWSQPAPSSTPAPQVHAAPQPPVAAAPPAQAPAPTGQYSDAGKPILFYVKAMYDYSASSEEEFSFTTGDIIAVTQTDSDGWWQGELLDEARRRRGANTFPSNFTTLLT